jgi:hypothetical protein
MGYHASDEYMVQEPADILKGRRSAIPQSLTPTKPLDGCKNCLRLSEECAHRAAEIIALRLEVRRLREKVSYYEALEAIDALMSDPDALAQGFDETA